MVGLSWSQVVVRPSRRWVLVVVVTIILAVALALVAAAVTRISPRAVVGRGSEWQHTLQVVANLREWPPRGPVVLLFGGSAARESTVSDAVWQAQVHDRGGSGVLCFNVASNVQSFADDARLIRELPDGGQTQFLVYIGLNPGRYCQPPVRTSVPLPPAASPLPPYDQHHYDERRGKAKSWKRQLAREWLRDRRPVFERRYAYNSTQLHLLVETCLSRGMRPVLLDLPHDPAVDNDALAACVRQYRRDGRRLAEIHGIPWVSIGERADLTDRDFYDLWHMVGGPGRAKWQRLLSDTTVTLLLKYGMADRTGLTSAGP